MDDLGNMRDDMRLPDENEKDIELAKRIQQLFEAGSNVYVVILSAMGIEKVIDASEKTN
jgi:hypothetical protein